MNRAIFLDRDGVINIDHGYVYEIKDFEFIPEALEALKTLSKSKYKLFVVTSQSGIGRKYFGIEDYEILTTHMLDIFKKKDIRIDRIYTCTHHPDDNCECRKPKIKFLLDAKREFNIDLTESFFIGDLEKDIKTGKKAGCKTILVLSGQTKNDKDFKVKPDFIAKDLYNAVNIILGDKK